MWRVHWTENKTTSEPKHEVYQYTHNSTNTDKLVEFHILLPHQAETPRPVEREVLTQGI